MKKYTSDKRRKLLKGVFAGSGAIAAGAVPGKWTKPVVESVLLPAHAATTCTEEGYTVPIRIFQDFSTETPTVSFESEGDTIFTDLEVNDDSFSGDFTTNWDDGCTESGTVQGTFSDNSVSGSYTTHEVCPDGSCDNTGTFQAGPGTDFGRGTLYIGTAVGTVCCS
ncbi:MAG: hypothetical protein GY726_01315 [Proteobacteria bacterium]|nr:hypothetical protein [Pseudomonadota bacterium]